MIDLADCTVQRLQQQLVALGFKPSHAAPILRSFYAAGGCEDFGALRLPRSLAGRLRADAADEVGFRLRPVSLTSWDYRDRMASSLG